MRKINKYIKEEEEEKAIIGKHKKEGKEIYKVELKEIEIKE